MQPFKFAVYENQYKTRLEYISSYIREHYAEEMSLDMLAKMAGFSKYHFHRVFQANLGETVRDYIRRIRLEKAAGLLISGQKPSITQVAYDCGFSSSQHFTHAFREHFGVSPRQARSPSALGELFVRKMANLKAGYGKKYRLPGKQEPEGLTIKISMPPSGIAGDNNFLKLEVVQMPAYRVAYVRTLTEPGGDGIGQAMSKIADWAAHKGIFRGDSLLMGVISSDPDPRGKLVYDASVSVCEDIAADESQGIRIQSLPEGEYGIYRGRFQALSEIASTWQRLFHGLWISSYFPRDIRPSYEIYYNDGRIHPKQTWFVDLCLPVTTLQKK